MTVKSAQNLGLQPGSNGYPAPAGVNVGGTGYGGDLGATGTAGEMSGGAGGAGLAGYGGGGIAGVQGSGFGGPGGSAGRAAGFGGPVSGAPAGYANMQATPARFSQSLPTVTTPLGVKPVQPGTPIRNPNPGTYPGFPVSHPGDYGMIRDPRSIAGSYQAGGKGPFGTSFGGVGVQRNPGIGDRSMEKGTNPAAGGALGNLSGNAPGSGSTGGPNRGSKGGFGTTGGPAF